LQEGKKEEEEEEEEGELVSRLGSIQIKSDMCSFLDVKVVLHFVLTMKKEGQAFSSSSNQLGGGSQPLR